MKKILVFAQTAVGGAERMSVTVTKTLDRSRFEVIYYLVGPTENGHAPLEAFIPSNMKANIITSQSPISLIARMFWILVKEKPDVVFASVINLNNKLLLLRPLFKKIKFIARCDNYLYTYNEKQQKMIKQFYPKADCIIAQTQEMKDELVCIGIDEAKIKALQNPIDKQTIDKKVAGAESPYPDNGKKHFVAVGRFNEQKGFDMLIDAFIKVSRGRKDVDLYIVGDYSMGNGQIHQSIMQKAKEAGVDELVHCVGYKDNPYVYVKNADCFVLSSRWEGLPNVLIESLYLGTPAAAFKCIPVIERIIEHGISGFCAEKENVASLAEAMAKTLDLGKINSTYKSSSIDEFTNLF